MTFYYPFVFILYISRFERTKHKILIGKKKLGWIKGKNNSIIKKIVCDHVKTCPDVLKFLGNSS